MTSPTFSAKLASGTTLTNVEGKAVLFSIRTGESYGLNGMAAEMLRALLASDSASAAADIAQNYAATPEIILQDMGELAAELAALKLIDLQH